MLTPPVIPRRRLLAAPLLCLALVAAGCGSGEARKPVYPVRGSVFVDGQPAVRAQVVLHPLDDPDPNAVRPSGDVGPDGTFVLHTYTADDGAPAGQYAVTVTWP